jgi:CRISPR-associated endonuclease Csn1
VDILEGPNGIWFQHATNIWAANSVGAEPWNVPHPDARFIMRVHKNDTIQLFDWDDKDKCVVEGSNKIKRILRLSPSNSVIYLVGISDAGDFQKRHNDTDDPFRWDFANVGKLKLRRARRVRVDELGLVHTIPHGTI